MPDLTFYEGFFRSSGDSGSAGLKGCLGFSRRGKGLWASRDFSVKLWDFWGGREKGLGVGLVWLFIEFLKLLWLRELILNSLEGV